MNITTLNWKSNLGDLGNLQTFNRKSVDFKMKSIDLIGNPSDPRSTDPDPKKLFSGQGPPESKKFENLIFCLADLYSKLIKNQIPINLFNKKMI